MVQRTFNLTDEEKYLLLESDVGEGIFFAGLKHVAIKVIASYTEDQIITSNPSQVLAIKKAKLDLEQKGLADLENGHSSLSADEILERAQNGSIQNSQGMGIILQK